MFGKDLRIHEQIKGYLQDGGFADVVETVYIIIIFLLRSSRLAMRYFYDTCLERIKNLEGGKNFLF